MASPITSRLALQQTWDYDIPLKFLWVVELSPRDGAGDMSSIGNTVSKYINDYEPGGFSVDASILNRGSVTDDNYGILLAQSIALPNEQFQLSTESLLGAGGFRAGYFAGQRVEYGSQNKIDITFLETNRDIFENFIKPWLVAVSYKGLVEDGSDNLKCNINLVQYARTDERIKSGERMSWKARKQYTFYSCVPFNIETEQLSYNTELSLAELSRTVAFAFEHYKVEDKA